VVASHVGDRVRVTGKRSGDFEPITDPPIASKRSRVEGSVSGGGCGGTSTTDMMRHQTVTASGPASSHPSGDRSTTSADSLANDGECHSVRSHAPVGGSSAPSQMWR